MDTNALFIKANKEQFRYDSKKGPLTTEDLFQLDLLHRSNCDLENVAQEIARQLESMVTKSFVDVRPNPQKATLELKLEVVKTVIKIKQDEAAAAQARAAKQAQATALRDAIHEAKKTKMAQTPLEELEKQLAALEA